MKKILTFIPLGIGISAAIIYIFNIIQFRIINNSATLFQILSNLKVYLYVSIAGFIFYFLIKIIILLSEKQKTEKVIEEKEEVTEIIVDDSYEPFEKINYSANNTYTPNYDYVPLYNESNKEEYIEQINNEEEKKYVVEEEKEIKKIVIRGNKYCYNCGEKIFNTDRYCSHCGYMQYENKKGINPVLKKIIEVVKVVILILIIYFLLNMLFEYVESKDPSFKSPFKISMTK